MNMMKAEFINHSTAVLAQGYDPGVEPRFDAPWMGFFRTLGGQILGTIMACIVIFMGIALAFWVASKIGGSGAGQSMGAKALLIGLAACVIMGSLGGAAMYFSGLSLF
ncbi:hypothetical protein BI49514_02395 [Brevibacterium iodinum ATCC 49514]|uniref:Uncharacterized protein n=1 Tax=Brevibacterium iodinum ATCC 49514 TaxID=1255616 RepID=A0A2H1JV22_9MICO|nr:hypothetical protein [Brevibacterium iodinum]SMX91385.1 hypothetical protein BI49514_02395 [Brevibacterium iodinum ATCC 49514]SUW70171.1 Uncharacterised protein [Brevibacterium iodinum]